MKIDWTQFKNFVDNRKVEILMFESANNYKLFIPEYGMNVECELDKNPSETTDLDDFETNYKSLCNPEKINLVTPTAPSNDYDLKPYGLTHQHINSSTQIFDITLSNKDGQEIDYSECSTTPQFYDCIVQDHSQTRDGIYSVDGSTLTMFMGRMNDGVGKLIRPVDIDYTVEVQEDVSMIYLWGAYIEVADYGEDDLGRLQIVDKTGVGVALGLYTQQEFEAYCAAQGGAVIIKEYDECWIRHISKLLEINTPDGAPGEIPVGMTLRLKYYPKDPTKTDIKIWKDYKITIKS